MVLRDRGRGDQGTLLAAPLQATTCTHPYPVHRTLLPAPLQTTTCTHPPLSCTFAGYGVHLAPSTRAPRPAPCTLHRCSLNPCTAPCFRHRDAGVREFGPSSLTLETWPDSSPTCRHQDHCLQPVSHFSNFETQSRQFAHIDQNIVGWHVPQFQCHSSSCCSTSTNNKIDPLL